jgi:hypothetical protein
VCNSKEIISIIELKYSPRAQPKYEKDIQKLSSIAKHRHQITMVSERFRGTRDNKKYALSDKILFVWAGVHAKEKSGRNRFSNLESKEFLKGCFIEWHAETQKGSDPKVFKRKW